VYPRLPQKLVYIAHRVTTSVTQKRRGLEARHGSESSV